MNNDAFKNYDAWKTRTPWDNESDHDRWCPAREDADPFFSVCEAELNCECYDTATLRGLIQFLWNGPCEIDPEPECTCPSPAEIKAERAERRAEMMEDR